MANFEIVYSVEELRKLLLQPPYEPNIIFDGKPVHTIMDPNELAGKVFRNYPENKIIEVSNFGRIRINNEIQKQWEDDPNGKDYLKLKIGKIIDYPFYVYRFVAETWLKCPTDLHGWCVHHITNNGYDNRPLNLLWLKKWEHDEIHKKYL